MVPSQLDEPASKFQIVAEPRVSRINRIFLDFIQGRHPGLAGDALLAGVNLAADDAFHQGIPGNGSAVQNPSGPISSVPANIRSKSGTVFYGQHLGGDLPVLHEERLRGVELPLTK